MIVNRNVAQTGNRPAPTASIRAVRSEHTEK